MGRRPRIHVAFSVPIVESRKPLYEASTTLRGVGASNFPVASPIGTAGGALERGQKQSACIIHNPSYSPLRPSRPQVEDCKEIGQKRRWQGTPSGYLGTSKLKTSSRPEAGRVALVYACRPLHGESTISRCVLIKHSIIKRVVEDAMESKSRLACVSLDFACALRMPS